MYVLYLFAMAQHVSNLKFPPSQGEATYAPALLWAFILLFGMAAQTSPRSMLAGPPNQGSEATPFLFTASGP